MTAFVSKPASALVALVLCACACDTRAKQPPTTPATPPATPHAQQLAASTEGTRSPSATVAPWLTLEALPAISGFERPVHVTGAGDGSQRLFVVEQTGQVRALKAAAPKERTLFLDVRTLLGSDGGEQGLLGLAFHPQFRTNRRLFIAYTSQDEGNAFAELTASTAGTAAPLSSLRVLFSIADFASNHNGGHLAFAPPAPAGDGKLYLGTGDGGGGGDPQRTAHNANSLLGKMIVLDVDAKAPLPLKPAWRYWGLRNPWRYAFDAQNGDLWIADVGQNKFEELHHVPASRTKDKLDFGWSEMEASSCFRGACDKSKYEAPVFEYPHGEPGCSITGGVVLRGAHVPQAAQGTYVFGDYCSGHVWIARATKMGVEVARVMSGQGNISSFGTDDEERVWLVDHRGSIVPLVVRAAEPAQP